MASCTNQPKNQCFSNNDLEKEGSSWRFSVIDQAEHRAEHAEDPVHDPYAEDVPLLFIQNAFQTS